MDLSPNPTQLDHSQVQNHLLPAEVASWGITRIRRHRWPIEVYHEVGKVDGLDQYQVRDFEVISQHIALVAVTYSLRRAAHLIEPFRNRRLTHSLTNLPIMLQDN
jgi:hypothetical protein